MAEFDGGKVLESKTWSIWLKLNLLLVITLEGQTVPFLTVCVCVKVRLCVWLMHRIVNNVCLCVTVLECHCVVLQCFLLLLLLFVYCLVIWGGGRDEQYQTNVSNIYPVT